MRRLLFLSLIASSALLACSGEEGQPLDPGPKDSGPAAPIMVELSTSAIGFGAVVVGTSDRKTLTVSNPSGDTQLVTLSVPTGANAERFQRSVNVPEENGAFPLEAGGVATVTVDVSAEAEGPIAGAITIDSCGGSCAQEITLTARGTPTGIVCPVEVDVGAANPGGCIEALVTCVNEGSATERITAVELDPASADAFVLRPPAVPLTLGPDQTLAMDVSYCPEAVSQDTGEIVVFTFEPFQTEQRIRLVGAGGGADVTCTPAAVDFGMVGVGADVDAFVTCRNDGVEDALLMPRVTDSTEFTADEDAVVAPGEVGTLSVRHMPATEGAKQGTLEIVTNDPDDRVISIPLSSQAITIGPCNASINPASIDFGLSGVGDEREAAIVVQNTGTEPCLFRRASMLPGSDPTLGIRDLPPIGTALAPGERRRITPTFLPAQSGVVEGTLDVSFSNPGTPTLQVAITGRGGDVPLAMDPPVLDFGDVPTGCGVPVTRTITLRRIEPGMGSIVNASIEQDGSDFSIAASSLPAQLAFFDSTTITVGFDPSATGFASASLRLVTGGSVNPISIPIVARAVPDVARRDVVTLTPRTMDLLFVVDDSCSMALSQAGLAEAADIFTDALADRNVDANIAVITTDMEDGARSGRFLGTPAVLHSSDANLLSELETRFEPGIGGSGTEAGIAASVAAVTAPLTTMENAGFLRPNADLAVFVLSDENDFSEELPSIEDRVRTLRVAAGGGRLYMSAIVGPPIGADCLGPYGLGQLAERYGYFVSRAGARGLLLSYCADMRESVAAAASHLFGGASVELSTRPVISTIAVSVDGTALMAGDFAYEATKNRIVFTDSSVAPAGATVEITYDAHCVSPTCGDGNVDAGEQCDDMNMSTMDACVECFDAICGDGYVNAGFEECDDGNLDTTDSCVPTCENARCGDGFVQFGVEECDDGNTTPGDGCPALCRFYVQSPRATRNLVELTNGSTITFGGTADPADDGVATLNLPFTFSFYDQPYTTVHVSVNGFLSFAPIDPASSYENDPIPSTAAPNGTIAGWWLDLELDESIPGGADVSWTVLGTAPSRTFVVQWRDVRAQDHNSNNHRRFTFQIALFEADNRIELRWGETETRGRVPTATDASVGIEDGSGTLGLEALGCSPNCDGRPRPPRADGFPENSYVTFTP